MGKISRSFELTAVKAIAYNYRLVKKAVSPKIKIMTVVKANAYGHGTVEVSKVLERLGVDYLGVATTEIYTILFVGSVRCV